MSRVATRRASSRLILSFFPLCGGVRARRLSSLPQNAMRRSPQRSSCSTSRHRRDDGQRCRRANLEALGSPQRIMDPPQVPRMLSWAPQPTRSSGCSLAMDQGNTWSPRTRGKVGVMRRGGVAWERSARMRSPLTSMGVPSREPSRSSETRRGRCNLVREMVEVVRAMSCRVMDRVSPRSDVASWVSRGTRCALDAEEELPMCCVMAHGLPGVEHPLT